MPSMFSATNFPVYGRGSSEFLYPRHDGHENISVIVRHFILEHRDDALETHISIDVFDGQGFKSTVLFVVKLDEDIIPDFDQGWVITVHEMSHVTATYPIDVHLTGQFCFTHRKE